MITLKITLFFILSMWRQLATKLKQQKPSSWMEFSHQKFYYLRMLLSYLHMLKCLLWKISIVHCRGQELVSLKPSQYDSNNVKIIGELTAWVNFAIELIYKIDLYVSLCSWKELTANVSSSALLMPDASLTELGENWLTLDFKDRPPKP